LLGIDVSIERLTNKSDALKHVQKDPKEWPRKEAVVVNEGAQEEENKTAFQQFLAKAFQKKIKQTKN
jgi:hypothetical protein